MNTFGKLVDYVVKFVSVVILATSAYAMYTVVIVTANI